MLQNCVRWLQLPLPFCSRIAGAVVMGMSVRLGNLAPYEELPHPDALRALVQDARVSVSL